VASCLARQASAKKAVGAWIENRYNRRRRHSTIGRISPVAFEMGPWNQTAANQQAT
jgi:transposase InsO family protein